MFVLYDKQKQKFPVKIWLESKDQIEETCMEQILNLANLPFIHKWVAIMPDTHAGIGMPIGGVIATDKVIIPNAVGVDIGCGMAYIETNIPSELLKNTDTSNGKLIQVIVNDILKEIPLGFEHHKKKQPCMSLDRALENIQRYKFAKELIPELQEGYFQVGTLGGGNHFIEIQEDEDSMTCIMLHSGSRNFGYKICNYFNKIAEDLTKKRYPGVVPEKYKLAFLPVDTEEGKSYIEWMNLALDFAKENRQQMLEKVMSIFTRLVNKYLKKEVQYSNPINCHHNYAALETHYGRKVWVHRKGAIRAGKDEMGIIPGAMGSYSYIVKGLGNPESFYSCSHGAGRKCSRNVAKKSYSVEEVMDDLKKCNVVLGKPNKRDVAEESRFVYKEIDFVINNQLDLIQPVKKLKTIGVIKG